MGSNSKGHRRDWPALDKGKGSKATLVSLLSPQIFPFVSPLGLSWQSLQITDGAIQQVRLLVNKC